MNANVICRYCRSRAAAGCEHLALAAAPGDFVRLCIEHADAPSAWRTLCEQNPRADFTWLETDFAERFLTALHWFGGVEYEWRRPDEATTARELWVLLWSKNPQRLWWELYDRLTSAAAAETASPAASAVSIRCPGCGKSPAEECAHLIIHGDDLKTVDVLSLFNPKADWSRLRSEATRLPDDAATFLREFAGDFPSLAGVERLAWNGESLGLHDDYLYVWAKDPAAFESELGKFLKSA